METRSKARGGLLSSMELGQGRQSPQSPVARSSSESSLNLTMVHDDGTAGVVGSSRSEVRVAPNPDTRPPTSTSVDQVSAAAGNSMVREPVTDYHRDGALTAMSTAVAAVRERNPTLSTVNHASTHRNCYTHTSVLLRWSTEHFDYVWPFCVIVYTITNFWLEKVTTAGTYAW